MGRIWDGLNRVWGWLWRPSTIELIAAFVTLCAAWIAKDAANQANRVAEQIRDTLASLDENVKEQGRIACTLGNELVTIAQSNRDLTEEQTKLLANENGLFTAQVSLIQQASSALRGQTALLAKQRIAYLQKQLHEALDNAEECWDCRCAEGCLNDVRLRTAMSVASWLERELSREDPGAPRETDVIPAMEYARFNLLGSAFWDRGKLAINCEKGRSVALICRDPFECYLAHFLLGYAQYAQCHESKDATAKVTLRKAARDSFAKAIAAMESSPASSDQCIVRAIKQQFVLELSNREREYAAQLVRTPVWQRFPEISELKIPDRLPPFPRLPCWAEFIGKTRGVGLKPIPDPSSSVSTPPFTADRPPGDREPDRHSAGDFGQWSPL